MQTNTVEVKIPIIAYRERESYAEAGVIKRREWRVRPVEDFDEAVLVARFGRDWRYHYGGTHVIEERMLRTGTSLEPGPVENTDAVEEPWHPEHLAPSYEECVMSLDSGATFVCPVLRRVEDERAAVLVTERERVAAHLATAQRALDEQADREWRAARSAAAFDNLARSKDHIWAERWNAFTSAATPADVERLRVDAKAVALHDAVIAAESVPAKRKAIRAFLAHVENR